MNKKPKLEENEFEWTTEMTKSSKRFNQLPISLQEKLKSRTPRDTQIAPTKIQTFNRLSVDVISSFKASRKGWHQKSTVFKENISLSTLSSKPNH
ncbi:hypothetical protein PSHI8_14150 [Polynucleobacter sp. SHI8]|uniref:hypothetical protein n=1 Tax=unclassified Polynucleobacter TaxID=2640945 RepID=UPI0024923F84|nr:MULTISPECIES: hypothetical protein [unclassified Polynucleobacter]BDW11332.1 hypothetical protein PSHI2_14140 [Polynucleobacter sp. SHI2]BDW13779.1 hypothetical protein PSHI8_14150 [Polynucleobacter sp. SHI8]